MSEAQIADRAAEHQQWLDRLANQPDPGAGKSAKEAGAAREKHLQSIEKVATEVDRLEGAIKHDPSAPTASHRNYKMKRAAVDAAPRSEKELNALHASHAAMRAQEHERETRSKLARLKDRRKHPPDPRAASVFAALVSSPWLAEALERKLRSGIRVYGDGGEQMLRDDEYITSRILEAQDVAVLFLASKAIEEGGLFSASTPADRGLNTLGDVAGSLSRLRRNDVLTVRREAERKWRVGWGERAIRTARDAGVTPLPSVLHEPVEEILTRS
jgi:hypothetical protein